MHYYKTLCSIAMVCMIGWCTIGNAQKKEFTLSGTILDKGSNQPLEYATVVLENLSQENEITGGVTNAKGKFDIKIASGNYRIRVEYLSYITHIIENQQISKNTDLGIISMEADVSALEEVVVTGEKTTVEVRLDKKIYNIGKDLTTSGATVSDALNNVPSVTVDIDGAISLRGNENVRILINGKPSALVGFGSNDVLQQLPADAIDRVEVITSPSARYDAEGTAGILNIVLRKDRTLGFNGTVNMTAGHPIFSRMTSNLNLRTDAFNIFGTLGYDYSESPGNGLFDNTYTSGDFDRILESRDILRQRQGHNLNLGVEYYINEKSSIVGSFFTRQSDDEDNTDIVYDRFINNVLDSESLRVENEMEDAHAHQVALNYENNFNSEGHKLTADFQYSYDKREKTTGIDENIVLPTSELIDRETIFEIETQNELLLQADYVLPVGDSQFELGYRGDFEETVTDYRLENLNLDTGEFEVDEGLTNVFTYMENINALYTQYGNKWKKFSFLLGLRLENTQLKGQVESDFDEEALEEALGEDIDLNFDENYLGLFPTVNLIYELAENENITLGYNRRINRPRGFFVNPFPSRSSIINIFQGNPDLDPAFANAYDLGYLKRWEKLTITSSIYYQKETNSFEIVQEETGETTPEGINIIRSVPINLSTNERYGTELGILYNPKRWLRLNWSINAFQFVSEGNFNSVEYGTENTSWFSRFSSKLTLPGKIEWQTNANYRGPRQNAQTKYKGVFFMDLAFSKEIFNDNATLAFNVRDVLNSRKRFIDTDTDFFTSDGELQRRERQWALSLVYRINQKKERGKRERQQDFDDDGEGEF
ncbi:TonB-dependent receptor domain-containing protein [Ulvibacterium marinum]|nr:TonB-dependent receptor [Ulvibacterium marinum]